MAFGRRTQIELTWQGVGISDDIAPYLLGLNYTEHLTGAADDLSIELEDRDGLWRGDWRPAFGDTCIATVRAEPWISEVEELRLGVFAHDRVRFSGPPARCSISAVSAPLSTNLRRRRRTRTWQGRTLWQIGEDIATRAGLELSLEGADEPLYKRRNQTDRSDLDFLEELAKETGRGVKVTDGKIAIVDERQREKSRAIGTITVGTDPVLSWDFEDDDSARYRACRVSFYSPEQGKLISGTYTDPVDSEARQPGKHTENQQASADVYEVRRAITSIAEAEQVARGELRNANRYAKTGSLTVAGDLGLVAGVTVNVAGLASLDGKFIITKAAHRFIGGYTVGLDVRRCAEDL